MHLLHGGELLLVLLVHGLRVAARLDELADQLLLHLDVDGQVAHLLCRLTHLELVTFERLALHLRA